MRNKATLFLLVVGALSFALGFFVFRAADADDTQVLPRSVVAMTSYEFLNVGSFVTLHFFRVWSDGVTEWNCRRTNTDNGFVFWGEWQVIEDATDPSCP